MNIFQKIIASVVNNALRAVEYADPSMKESHSDFGSPLHITVHDAVGGKIITFRYYNEKTNKHYETIYLIHNEENLSDCLGKFLTVELLKI